MDKASQPRHRLRNALIALYGAAAIGLIAAASAALVTDELIKGPLIAGILILLAPLILWRCVVASNAIKAQPSPGPALKRAGLILGFPKALLGALCLFGGLVVPFRALRDISTDIVEGKLALLPVLYLPVSLLLLIVSDYVIRDGLGLPRAIGRRVRVGPWKMNELPRRVRILLLGYLLALGFSLTAFAVAFGIYGLDTARIIWRPVESIVTVLASLVVATFIVRWSTKS